ncbi:MAG TPA: histidine kinase N-terminal 7TM domain-containing protein [Anaerolineaceae bacterium]|nr:histidine kinase N-terminal 7TM domain-containing protein [Anaerolineaceae bacterium]HPN51260.1 histidine kinase N-terminal 7TM domain-containing protein [Anaerolineaceae bacterium]
MDVDLSFRIYYFGLILAFCISFEMVRYSLQHLNAVGGKTFFAMMSGVLFWITCTLIPWIIGPDSSLFWYKVGYLGVEMVPVSWFLFSLAYNGLDVRRLWRYWILLLIIPVWTLTGVWGEWFWESIRFISGEEFKLVAVDFQPSFWIPVLNSYALVIAGGVLLIIGALKSHEAHRGRRLMLLLASFLPLSTNILYMFGLTPQFDFDMTPISFAFSGAALGYGFVRYRLMNLVPVAHSSMVEHMEDGVMVLDPSLIILYCGDSFEKLSGLTLHQIREKRFSEVFPEIPFDPQQPVFEAALPAGPAPRVFQVRCSNLKDEQTGQMGYLLVWHDITARKQMEMDLANSTTRFTRLFMEAPLPMIEADASQMLPLIASVPAGEDPLAYLRQHPELARAVFNQIQFRLINDAMLNLFQAPDRDSLQHFFFSNPADQIPMAAAVIFMPDQTTTSFDFDARTFNGEQRFLRIQLSNLSNPGQFDQILILAVDVTAQQHSLLEMKKAMEHERNMNQIKSRFTAMVSHQFRTPLNVILSSSELLRNYEDRLSSQQKERCFLRTVESIQQMTTLLDEVLMLDRAESASLPQHILAVDLNAFCREMAERFTDINHKNQLVRSTYAGPEKQQMVNKFFLTQVVENLLSNATKYSPEGSEIHLRCQVENGQAAFEVQDHGVGIPKDELKNIGDPFYRASNVQDVKGTGLGMAVVNRYLAQMGGKMEIDSHPDRGTRINFAIPVTEAEPPEEIHHEEDGENLHIA